MEEYQNIIKDLLEKEEVKEMNNYRHHFDISCLEHSNHVAYYSYLISKKHNLNYEELTRAALLHDLFLYDWHTHKCPKGFTNMHGFSHPKEALKNAKKITKISDMQEDVIVKHMWPLTVKLPKYKETWIITLTDKIATISEYLEYKKKTRNSKILLPVLESLLIILIIKL